MPFFETRSLPVAAPLPGVTRRAVWLEGVMLTVFDFEPGAVVPEHAHPHEQITFVLEGELVFTLGTETRVIRAGDGVTIPANVPHRAVTGPVPTRALDAWNPIREDYR